MNEGELTSEQQKLLREAKTIHPNPRHEFDAQVAAYTEEYVAKERKRLDARWEAAIAKREEKDAKRRDSWWGKLFK